ncbi:uncharacterized protein LOC123702288 isoform X2 [Colias croceus]|uniref:uncharacterized protein LOC123702288 isoform X2 n=1 Tax=Colias crocea TaxID=72248 RepID=UPI001E27BCA5|nr:uncharacterized protein LOC123702288 isoform X2 [Colias croceus]
MGFQKKFLIEPTAREDEEFSSHSLITDLSPCETKPSTSKQQALCSPKRVEEITSTSGQESFSQDQAGFKGTTSPSPQLVEMIPTSGQQVLKDAGSLRNISFYPLLSTEQYNLRELSVEINSSNETSEVLDTSAAVTTNLEESLTVLYSPRKRRLKKTIIKMKMEMENKNKKIRLLNQKVRRLKNRNESLKDVLKTLKEDNYVENDMDNFVKYKLVRGKLKLKKGVVPHKFACQERSVEEPERSSVKMFNIEETHIKVEYSPQDQDIIMNDPLEDVTRGENLRSTTATEDSLKMKHKEIQVNLTNKVYLNKSTETEDKYFHVTSMD